MSLRYDFVVAGSGPGGATVAARLAQGGARVLLLEKGGPARATPEPLDAVGLYYAQGGMMAAFGAGGVIPVPTGICLGGTSAINSGTCRKTPAAILKNWETKARGAFDAGEFSQRLEEAWTLLGARRCPPETMSRSSRLVLDGLSRLGIQGGAPLDRAETGCLGSGRCCFICPRGAKRTAFNLLLDPPPPGLDLRPLTELAAIEAPARPEEPVRITLLCRQTGKRERVHCEALVLSCGALATPYFVRRFRLGQRWRLAGDGLSLHPASEVFALFDSEVEPLAGVPQGAGFEDPEDTAVCYEGAALPRPLAAMAMPLEGSRLGWWRERYRNLASFGFMIKDSARGNVRYPLGPEMPWIRYLLAPEDHARAALASRRLAEVFFAAGARRALLPFNTPAAEVLDAAAGRRFDPGRARTRMMGFHPLGTCGLGRVVDADLAVSPRIFVCDGSVVPESLGVNPQVTLYAFALRLARRLISGRLS